MIELLSYLLRKYTRKVPHDEVEPNDYCMYNVYYNVGNTEQ